MPGKRISENTAFRGYWYKAAELKRITDPAHKWFDPRAAKPADPAKFEALCLSIDAMGVEMPLEVAKDDGGNVCVVDGNQRHMAVEFVNAARADGRKGLPDYAGAGTEEIQLPVIFKRDDAAMLAHKAAANTGRSEETPTQRASHIQRLLDQGKSLAQAAAIVGLKPDVAGRYVKLLDLSSKLRTAVDSGALAADAAFAYVALSKPEQDAAFERAVEAGGGEINRHVAKAAAQAVKSEKAAAKKAVENGEAPPPARRLSVKPGSKRIKAAIADLDALAKTLSGEEKKRVLAMADALDWAATGAAGEYVAKYIGQKAAEIDTRAPKAKTAPVKTINSDLAVDPEF